MTAVEIAPCVPIAVKLPRHAELSVTQCSIALDAYRGFILVVLAASGFGQC
jgi:hypothetical protein